MKLIVAEKPSVAKAICPVVRAFTKKNGYMEGNNYIVSWCLGHLVCFSKPEKYEQWAEKWSFEQLPIVPEKWKFEIIPKEECKKQFNVLKTLMNDNNIDEIICATDADREGECIFRYVYKIAGCRKPVKRLWVSSLEESAIIEGLKKMKNSSEYDKTYLAGFSRAKADWLVGMNATRLFRLRYKADLNLGRVQTPTLAMIVKRDSDVKNFVKQKYFTVDLNCGNFIAFSDRIDDENTAEKIVSLCNGKNAVVTELKKEIKTANPPKLFDLTTLQREANKKFGYTAKQTLDALQHLYEAKLSTYPRTDSQYLTDDMEQTAIKAISDVYSVFPEFNCGISYIPDVKRCINNKKVSGHHAILPTEKITTANLSELPDEQKNILMLISAQLLLATGIPHKYETVKVTVNCENTLFTANGKTVVENGWKTIEEKVKSILKNKNSSEDEKEDTKSLPEIFQGQTFNNVSAKKSEHFTAPPKPYTEDTLLSAMEHAGLENYDDNSEKKGLGTPATRAAIIEGLFKNEVAERKGKQIFATEKGVNLINYCPDEIKSPKLTAEWEMKLQQIEHGEYSAEEFMNGIVSFLKEICSKYGSADENTVFAVNSETGNCPNCGKPVSKGKFGYYCTGKCGMNIAKVYGKELTESQIKKLLDGKQISYTYNDRKTVVLPKAVKNEYQGKTYFQWQVESTKITK